MLSLLSERSCGDVINRWACVAISRSATVRTYHDTWKSFPFDIFGRNELHFKGDGKGGSIIVWNSAICTNVKYSPSEALAFGSFSAKYRC